MVLQQYVVRGEGAREQPQLWPRMHMLRKHPQSALIPVVLLRRRTHQSPLLTPSATRPSRSTRTVLSHTSLGKDTAPPISWIVRGNSLNVLRSGVGRDAALSLHLPPPWLPLAALERHEQVPLRATFLLLHSVADVPS